MDKADEIKRLYYRATKRTIERDFDRAIDLLKSMATDAERERVHVFMEGLAQMRREWSRGGRRKPTRDGE
jgi:hypothetical protein